MKEEDHLQRAAVVLVQLPGHPAAGGQKESISPIPNRSVLLTEAIYPTFLHQDPRYFRRGTGTVFSRLAYSAGQIFLTHGDSGRTQFNFSEVAGNSTAVAISMAYYPENRNVGDAVSKLGVQLGVDMASNILKEFAPDIGRKFSHKHRE